MNALRKIWRRLRGRGSPRVTAPMLEILEKTEAADPAPARGSGQYTLSVADHYVLEEAAKSGQYRWPDLALQERAYWGIVLSGTWAHLTAAEREILGRMSDTAARRKLEI
jgi:hypothetical protein